MLTVCLRKGHHSVYADLVAHPPPGVRYLLPVHVTKSESRLADMLKKRAFSAYVHTFSEPHAITVPVPAGSQLIHATSGILAKNAFPWVIDTEHAASFCGFEAGRLEKVRPKVERLLNSSYCKKIMPWTEAGAKSIRNGLDASGFEKKIEVVYPAIQPLAVKKKKHDTPRLLFVSVRFFTKGGRELLEAFTQLRKKMDLELTIVSDVPEAWQKKYSDGITYLPPTVPRKTLIEEHFASADAFVLPSYMDTFGMVFLEAMSAGVPIVSTNVFAIPEIVGKAGKIITVDKYSWYGPDALFAWRSWKRFSVAAEREDKPEVVAQLAKAIETVTGNKRLRTQMALAGKKEVASGKFSVQRRNKALHRIYTEAIEAR